MFHLWNIGNLLTIWWVCCSPRGPSFEACSLFISVNMSCVERVINWSSSHFLWHTYIQWALQAVTLLIFSMLVDNSSTIWEYHFCHGLMVSRQSIMLVDNPSGQHHLSPCYIEWWDLIASNWYDIYILVGEVLYYFRHGLWCCHSISLRILLHHISNHNYLSLFS